MQRNTYRKVTWSGLHLQFSSFAPMAYERRLVRIFFYTHDQAQKEFIKRTLANGCSENFIEQHRR